MPEVTEVYKVRTSVNEVVESEMIVAEVVKPPRIFENRKVTDEEVNSKRPEFGFLQRATFFGCQSCNAEIALFFEFQKKIVAVKISLSLGVVLLWATKSNLKKGPLDLKAPKSRTNFYVCFENSDKILVLLDTSQNRNMAIWSIIHNVDMKNFKKIWKLELQKVPDAFDQPKKLRSHVENEY